MEPADISPLTTEPSSSVNRTENETSLPECPAIVPQISTEKGSEKNFPDFINPSQVVPPILPPTTLDPSPPNSSSNASSSYYGLDQITAAAQSTYDGVATITSNVCSEVIEKYQKAADTCAYIADDVLPVLVAGSISDFNETAKVVGGGIMKSILPASWVGSGCSEIVITSRQYEDIKLQIRTKIELIRGLKAAGDSSNNLQELDGQFEKSLESLDACGERLTALLEDEYAESIRLYSNMKQQQQQKKKNEKVVQSSISRICTWEVGGGEDASVKEEVQLKLKADEAKEKLQKHYFGIHKFWQEISSYFEERRKTKQSDGINVDDESMMDLTEDKVKSTEDRIADFDVEKMEDWFEEYLSSHPTMQAKVKRTIEGIDDESTRNYSAMQ